MNKSDILLVSPAPQSEVGLLYRLSGIVHPLGLGYLASYLRKNEYIVDLIDNSVARLSEKQFGEYLEISKPRYVGFSFYTGCLANAHDLARVVKKVDSRIIVVAGGPHASALPGDVFRNDAIDVVVRGEGEETLLSLLIAMDSKSGLETVEGISYRRGSEIMHNRPRDLIKDINALPVPSYDLFDIDKYFLAPSRRFTGGKAGSVITSRGCPQRCAFCSRAVFGRSIRYRTPENVVNEIENLVGKYGFTEFEIRDDTFTLDEDRAIAICDLIKARKIRILWNCCGRVNQISDKLLSSLYAAGCRAVFIGAEFGSQKMLDLMKKDITLEQIETAIMQCKKHKLLSLTSFIIGAPGETEETVRETILFAKRIDPDYVSFCAYTPLPGSELFDEFVAKGQIDIENMNWEDCVRLLLVPPPYQIGNFPPRELVKWQKKALREFYLRPRYILKRLARLRTIQGALSAFAGLHVVVGHQLKRFKF